MNAPAQTDLGRIEGLHWLPNGQTVLSGDILKLADRLDDVFQGLGRTFGASDFAVPPFLAAQDLAGLNYFRSFPHLATFAVTLGRDEENLRRFAEGKSVTGDGEVQITDIEPVRNVLTPAACYHFYPLFRGRDLDAPLYATTRAACFRRESHYLPLERQWSFQMREIVCIGSEEDVTGFLGECRSQLEALFERIVFPVDWRPATDPFFDPWSNPGYLGQKASPLKTEMRFGGHLALGSVNFHRDFFGRACSISHGDRAAFSGCVAFGIERWILAILTRFGCDPAGWPALDGIAGENSA